MDSIYIFLIIVLFILAFSDLYVGVANDAVNFLNSAIGAKAATFKTVLLVASIGLIVGATFSSGLMEIARKGLFHPSMFSFHDVMIIFVAVMIADVILLDIYNTFGLPTSTTVSIVFDLLGAAVGVAIVKISNSGQSMQDLALYINSGKALAIMTGILVSVVLAFSVGAIIQYITRVIFTFNIRHNLKYFASTWGATAITGIIFFIVIKGAEGASFVTPEDLAYIEHHTFRILLISFAILVVLLQILISLFKLNVLRLVVLVGTFALALAFAGNDMVNFIGVPLAGLKAFQLFAANPGADPHTFMMGGLAEDVVTETWVLIVAGLFMVVTLWTSKKAKTVIATEVDLGRQTEGFERFNSSILSRNIVRGVVNVSNAIERVLPAKLSSWLDSRFEAPDQVTVAAMPKGASFDMLRASVTLVVASVLIALGTSLKLPLSTTYVTFMVAMATSLSDKSWGRESAVYRITGVLSVIGGWLITGLGAFTIAILAGLIISWGGFVATLALLGLAVYLAFKTHKIHAKIAEERKANQELDVAMENISTENVISLSSQNMQDVLESGLDILKDTVTGLVDENRKLLKNAKANALKLNAKTKRLKTHMNTILVNLKDEYADAGQFYVQSIDYMREINHCVSYIVTPAAEHIENNHKSLIPPQIEELTRIYSEISIFTNDIINIMKKKNFEDFEFIVSKQQNIMKIIDESRKKQIKRIKNNETGTRNSILYLNILAEIKNLTLFSINLLKTERDLQSSKK